MKRTCTLQLARTAPRCLAALNHRTYFIVCSMRNFSSFRPVRSKMHIDWEIHGKLSAWWHASKPYNCIYRRHRLQYLHRVSVILFVESQPYCIKRHSERTVPNAPKRSCNWRLGFLPMITIVIKVSSVMEICVKTEHFTQCFKDNDS